MNRRIIITAIALFTAVIVAFATIDIGGGESQGAATTPEWVLRLPGGARYGAWSPNGRLFALPAHDRVEVVEADGDTVRRIAVPGLDNSGLSCECRLAWTRDGEQIHVVTRPRPRARGGVVSVGVDGTGQQERLFDLHVADAAWAPAGWPLVLLSGETVTHAGAPTGDRSQLLRLGSLKARPEPVLSRHGYVSNLAFSPDGSRFAFSAGGLRGREMLFTLAAGGGKPQRLGPGLLTPALSWSPGGDSLAVVALAEDRRATELLLVPAAGGKPRRLIRGPLSEESPAWTADGRWIAYARSDGVVEEVRPDGSGRRTLLSLPGEEIAGLSFSPHGHRLALTARPVPETD